MKNFLKIYICTLVCLMFTCQAQALTVKEFDDMPKHEKRDIPIPEETKHHWELAMDYKYDGRYELARQHFLLALATCNSTELRDTLKRELQSVDLQIRTMR